jgi:beta-glucosidase
MLHAFLEDMPLRGLLSFSGGKFTEEMLEQVLAQLNE